MPFAGKHVVLTGPPGVGKTTIVRKVIDELLMKELLVSGFYTEEIRDHESGKRSGFQVVTVDGKRGTLSSINSKSTLKVGNYGVELEEFESIALPSISQIPQNTKGVIIIDEIGKMELFSSIFKSVVDKLYAQPNSNSTVMLATIPIAKGKPIPFVEKIRSMPEAKLITVNKSNRDNLPSIVISTLLGLDKDIK